jgi:hypothetical protein
MDPADATHREVTRREFARQAPSFDRAGSIFRARHGGAATGLRTRREDAGLVIEHRWLIVGGARR